MHDNLHAGHYKGAKGALIVCDLTRRETLESMEDWIQPFWDCVGEVPTILLGNKSDLPHEVTESDLKIVAGTDCCAL